jgi:hypothetical protein
MDHQELRDILARVEWSSAELARRINRNDRGVRRIVAGAVPIDPPLAAWLRELDTAHAALGRVLERPPPNPQRGGTDGQQADDEAPEGEP